MHLVQEFSEARIQCQQTMQCMSESGIPWPSTLHTVGSGRDARIEQVRLTLELSMLATKEIRLEREIQQLRNERDMWMRRVLVLTTCSEKKGEREMERERECRRLMEDRLRMTEERFHRFQDEVVKYLRMECKSDAF